MTAPKRCKECGRSRRDLKGAKDVPVKHQSSLWQSGNGDFRCWACVGKRADELWVGLLKQAGVATWQKR